MSAGRRLVSFQGVSKRFAQGESPVIACSNLSFQIDEGEIVAIVGETGCGKSTALALLLGLQAPTEGSVRVLGLDPFAQFEQLKGRIGIIFQNDRLLPWRTALHNVTFGLEILHRSRQEREQLAQSWLERVGLGAFAHSYPHELSGGMRQRVSIARTFAIDPPLLLADEAFSALDEISAASLRADLIRLIQQTRKTTLFITHSVPEAVQLAHRVLVFGRPGHVIREVKAADMQRRGQTMAEIEAATREGMRLARQQVDQGDDADRPLAHERLS